MYCAKCGQETKDNENLCVNCQQPENQIEVLPPEERENFQGITLEQNESNQHHSKEGYYEFENNGQRQKVYVKHINMKSFKMGFLAKLLLGMAVMLLIVVALPLALLFLGIFLIGWFLNQFTHR